MYRKTESCFFCVLFLERFLFVRVDVQKDFCCWGGGEGFLFVRVDVQKDGMQLFFCWSG